MRRTTLIIPLCLSLAFCLALPQTFAGIPVGRLAEQMAGFDTSAMDPATAGIVDSFNVNPNAVDMTLNTCTENPASGASFQPSPLESNWENTARATPRTTVENPVSYSPNTYFPPSNNYPPSDNYPNNPGTSTSPDDPDGPDNPPTMTPEPATILLMVAGLGGLYPFIRSRRRPMV